jgi:uncharacterized C2H2 Zn-finger protein
MTFMCAKCDAVFKSNCDLTRHLNKKIPCGNEEKEAYKLAKRTCEYCEVLYADVQSVGKHMKICPLRPSETDELKNIIAQLSKQLNDKLNKQDDKLNNLSEQMKETKSITINNNIQNNIIITAFGQEDLSFLTLKDFKKILRKGCYSVPELLKLIHCNDDRPEYRNVYINNYKDEYMFTFDGKDWGIERKDDVFANMIENKKNFLESKMNDMQGELPQYAITMFQKFLEQSDNDEVIANIKDELKNMFYKNRNHVVKSVKPIKIAKTKPPKQITCTENIDTNTITNKPVHSNEKKPRHKLIK